MPWCAAKGPASLLTRVQESTPCRRACPESRRGSVVSALWVLIVVLGAAVLLSEQVAAGVGNPRFPELVGATGPRETSPSRQPERKGPSRTPPSNSRSVHGRSSSTVVTRMHTPRLRRSTAAGPPTPCCGRNPGATGRALETDGPPTTSLPTVSGARRVTRSLSVRSAHAVVETPTGHRPHPPTRFRT